MSTQFLQTVDLTDLELLRGKLLSAETKKYLRAVYTEMTLAAAVVDLSPTSEDRLANEINRAFDGGKRAFIEELLTDSESAQLEINAAMASNPQSATRS